jgi:hypothetical protein
MAGELGQATRDLLGTGGSTLATLLRYELVGLCSALRRAAADHPDDPGSAACAAVLAHLDPLVGGQPVAVAADRPATRASTPDAVWQAVLELDARPDAPAGWLAGAGADTPVADLARRAYLAALRLPADAAAAWREVLDRAVAGRRADGPWVELPGPVEQVLVAPVAGAAGVRSCPGAGMDADVAASLGLGLGAPPPNPDGELAAVATALVRLSALDDTLWLGLASLRHRGLAPFGTALQAAYRRTLLDRLTAYRNSAPGSPAQFRALLAVDEALNCVLHRPVADPGAWWASLGHRSRDVVLRAQQEHPDVAVRLLAYRYRDATGLTDGTDIGIDTGGNGGHTGEILACLRLWARIGEDVLPGRVIFAG